MILQLPYILAVSIGIFSIFKWIEWTFSLDESKDDEDYS
jgi:hypothetical protein